MIKRKSTSHQVHICCIHELKRIAVPVIVCAVSFVLNVICVLQMRKSPLFYFPQMDSLYHLEWAQRILSGDVIGSEIFFRAPLYPYVLAAALKLCNGSLVAVRILQGLIGSISIFFIFVVGSQYFSHKIGLSASIVAALYAPFLYFNGELLIVTLIVLLDLIILFALHRALIKITFARWLGAGIVTGFSAIARPNILLPAILLPIFLFFCFRQQLTKKTIAFYAGILIIICPILIRNYVVAKDFVPISSQAGINFYIGNNAHSDGVTAIAPGMKGSWWGGYKDAIQLAEQAMGRTLKPSEVSNFWMRSGFRFVFESPGPATKLTLKKMCLFFSGIEIPNNKDIYFFKHYSALLNILLWRIAIKIPKSSSFPIILFGFPFSMLFPFSVLGIIFAIRKREKRKLLLIFLLFVYYFSIIVFFVNARYRMPLIPILIMFAIYGCFMLTKRKQWMLFTIPATILLISMVNFWKYTPASKSQSLFNIGIAYANMLDHEQALKYYKQTIKEDHHFFLAYINMGNIYAKQNKIAEAESLYRQCIAINPRHEKAYFNLGHLYLKQKDYDKAFSNYEKAFTLDKEYVLAYYYAGLAKEKSTDREAAIMYYRKAVALRSDFQPARERLSRLLTNSPP